MKKFLKEFKEFALRGNVMDMAVGVIIGGAFTGIVTAFTDDFITPILSLIGGTEFGAILTRSYPASVAIWSASSAVTIPSCSPSAEISRTCGSRICSLISWVVVAMENTSRKWKNLNTEHKTEKCGRTASAQNKPTHDRGNPSEPPVTDCAGVRCVMPYLLCFARLLYELSPALSSIIFICLGISPPAAGRYPLHGEKSCQAGSKKAAADYP